MARNKIALIGGGNIGGTLAHLAGHIGDPHVRARGTIGGSIANNDPAADYPAACVGLGATIVTNEREIAADDFFTGMFDTALNDGELITSVVFPAASKAGYAKFANPASRYAMVGVFVAQASEVGRQNGRGYQFIHYIILLQSNPEASCLTKPATRF